MEENSLQQILILIKELNYFIPLEQLKCSGKENAARNKKKERSETSGYRSAIRDFFDTPFAIHMGSLSRPCLGCALWTME